MYTALDTTANVTPYLDALVAEGVKGISRYIAAGGALKLTHRPEIDAIHARGMKVFLNFEGRGNHIDAFSAAQGKIDATLSLNCARDELGAPKGCAIFLSCEPETIYGSYTIDGAYSSRVLPYYQACRDVLGDQYRLGIYSFGTWMRRLLTAKTVDLCWLPGASGWAGYPAFKASGDWAFRQLTPGEHGLEQNFHGLEVDWDEINPAFTDVGAWESGGVVVPPVTPPSLHPILRKGSRGADVIVLQTLLHITADGLFGPLTESAVKTFQAALGLVPDGVCGPLTWAKLAPT